MKFIIFLLFSFIFLNAEDSINSIESSAQDSKITESNIKSSDEKSRFLSGDTNLLSKEATFSVNNVSQPLFEMTKFQLFIHIIKEPTLQNAKIYGSRLNEDSSTLDSKAEIIESNTTNSPQDSQDLAKVLPQDSKADSKQAAKSRKEMIQDYEKEFTSRIRGEYAVIFLFFNEHYVDIKSNAAFLDSKIIKNLLEDYAYPYLPAEKVGSDKYINGVNEGLSNLYLATAHTIAGYYKVKLQAPKPMEKPSEATKIIIYIMLGILLVLFIIVSNGFFAKKGAKKN